MRKYLVFTLFIFALSSCDWNREVDPQWREFNESTLRVSNQEALFFQAVDLLSHSITIGDAFAIEEANFIEGELQITVRYEGGIGSPHFELLYMEEDHLEAGTSEVYVVLSHYQQQNNGRVMQTETLHIPLETSENPVSMQIVNGSYPDQRIRLKL